LIRELFSNYYTRAIMMTGNRADSAVCIHAGVLQEALENNFVETAAKLRPPDTGVAPGRREMRRRRRLSMIFTYLENIDWGIIF